MTIQEIINRLCIIKRDWPGTAQDIDRLLLVDLEAQLRFETAARSGNVNATRTIAKILKDNADNPRESLRYPWIDGDGRQCVCDGFQAFRLREHLALIERPSDAGEPIPLDRIFPSSLAGWKLLPMPGAKELREFITMERARWTGRRKDFCPVWDFGPQAPSINAQYLLNAATVFPDADTIFWNTLISPMVIRCEAGDCLMLPIRCAGKTQPEPASEAEQAAIDEEKARNEAVVRENQERARAIREAHDREYEANKDMDYAAARCKSLENGVANASNEELKSGLMDQLADARRDFALASLKRHAAILEYDPEEYMDAEHFETLAKMLYRDNAA